jgi:DNA-binding transcriptional MocR family regulator
MPHKDYFPFDTLEGAAALPQRFKPFPHKSLFNSSSAYSSTASSSTPESAQVVVPKDTGAKDILKEIDLKTALQYGTAQGYPPLYAFIRQFTRKNLHPNVPYKDGPEIILTCGSTDGMAKTVEAFTNPWFEDRDPVEERGAMLCEQFAYTNALQAVRPRGLAVVPVQLDDGGILVKGKGGLEDVLKNWDTSKGKRPHLLYTVTIGQNPTGATISVARRKQVYKVCVEYDILIIEDDPYWYLQYPSAVEGSMEARGFPPTTTMDMPARQNWNVPNSSGYPFLDSLVPSYLSVDYEGRVIRLDTFSKTVAPGCRLGWVTAQPAVVDRILRVTETSTQQPSGFVQSMIAQLLMGPDAHIPPSAAKDKSGKQTGWKMDGWVRWLEGLRGGYERRMNTMCKVLDEGRFLVKTGRRPSLEAAVASTTLADSHSRTSADAAADDEEDDEWRVITSTPMYDFQWPRGGMFVWISLNLASHPLARKYPQDRLARALWVFLTTKPYLVLVSPGTLFSPNEQIAEKEGWKFFRVCFAAMPEEEVKEISERFVDGVRAFWRKKDLDGIEEMAQQAGDIEAQAGVPGFC